MKEIKILFTFVFLINKLSTSVRQHDLSPKPRSQQNVTDDFAKNEMVLPV